MKAKSQRDLFAGLLFVAVGLVFAVGATSYEFGDSANPGPGYFPFGLGVLLAVLGGMVLFKSVTLETEDGEPVGHIGWRPLVVVCAAIVFFAFAMPRLGLPLAVALVSFGVAYASDEVQVRDSLLLSLGLAVFCTLVFKTGLGLNLPLAPLPLSAWGG